MIPYNEYIQYAPDTEGTVRVNHNGAGCHGSSTSMQITKRSNGDITAYCHRCGDSGYKRNEFLRTPRRAAKNTKMTEVHLPADIITEPSMFDARARVWLYKSRLDDSMIKKYGIVYTPYARRVLLPTYHAGILSSYQARKIYDSDEGPKYYTKYNGAPRYSYYTSETNKDTIIIVEDMLSAIRLITDTDTSVISLSGTRLYDEVLQIIIKKHKNFIVWLDNDNAKVLQHRVKIRHKLQLFGKVKTVEGTEEAKHLDKDSLREKVNELLGK